MKLFFRKFTLLLFILSFSALLLAQNTSNEELRNEAFIFSLSIIKTYFTMDCDSLKQKFASELYSLSDEEIMYLNEELKEEICDSIEDALEDKDKKFEDYLIDYNPRIFTKKEFEEQFEVIDPVGFEILDSDFFFLGNETKSPLTDEYIWDDLEVIMIRKIDGKWLIIGGK